MNRNVFLSVLGHYKVELDTQHEDYNLNLDAPKGKVFASNGCHRICVPWNNSGGQSWKSEAYEDAVIQVKMGLYDCDDPECEACHKEDKAICTCDNPKVRCSVHDSAFEEGEL